METAAPLSFMEEKPKDIKFINEYNLNFDNIGYLLKLGIVPIKIEELFIFVKEIDQINSFCYQSSFSLETLQKMNKSFRQFDSIEEIIDILKEIINEKKISFKKANKDLDIIFKFKKPGKGEEEIQFCLNKTNISVEKTIENLISHINNMKLEIKELKTEITNMKNNKVFIPVFENGWSNFHQTYEPLKIYKNQSGEVKFQGLIIGDFSKKLFTLEEEIRPKERLIFTICGNDSLKRLDILSNGNVYLSKGGSEGINNEYGWITLSGISYNVSK